MMKKRVLAIMLVCFMLVSLLPMGALAEENKPTCPNKGEEHYTSNCTYEKIDEITVCDGYNYVVYRCTVCDDTFADDFVKVEGEHAELVQKTAAVAPTCTKAGKTAVMRCPECDYVTGGVTIPALGHQMQEGATCVEDSVCQREGCGATLPGRAHTWGDRPTSIEAPTMTEDGTAVYTCGECGATKTVVVKHHDCVMEDKAGKAPTCEQAGYTAYQQCSICKEIVGKETIPETGHGKPKASEEKVTGAAWQKVYLPAELVGEVTFTNVTGGKVWFQEYDAASDSATKLDETTEAGQQITVTLEAGKAYRFYFFAAATMAYSVIMERTELGDCFTDTMYFWTCDQCGKEIEENLGKNHDYQLVHETEPTCTTLGWSVWVCQNPECGDYYAVPKNDGKALGHTDRPEGATLVPATCTKDAYYQWTCERCPQVLTEVVEGTAGCHIVESKHVDSNCKDKGYYYTYCDNNCDDCPVPVKGIVQINGALQYITDRVVEIIYLDVNPAAHNPVDMEKGIVCEESTCTEGKLIAYWCTWCETAVYESEDPLDHDWSEIVKEQAPTCDKNGYYYVDCNRCGEINITEEFTMGEEAYIYYDYEQAAACHNLEGAVRVVFRTGTCTVVGLDRYQCQDCDTYILVRDNTTGKHLPAPEDLAGRPDNAFATSWNKTATETFIWTAEYDGVIVYACNKNKNTVIMYTVVVTEAEGDTAPGTELIGETYIYNGDKITVKAGTTYQFEVYAYGETSKFTYEPHVQFAAKAPTCTEAGWTEAYFCERCGEYLPCTELPATGHNTVSKADCENAAVCSVCGPYGEPVGHKMGLGNVTKPTCTEAGYTTTTCSVCKKVEITAGEPALGHEMVFIDGMQTDADIREDDAYTYIHVGCSRCKGTFDYTYEYIEDYTALNICKHNYVLVASKCKSPTCSAAGYVVLQCKSCKDEIKLDEYEGMDLAQRPHENAAGVNLTLCENNEVANRTCKHCKKTIAKVAHDWKNTYYAANCMSSEYWVSNCKNCVAYEVHDGTCDNDGCEMCPAINPEKGPHAWCDWGEFDGEGRGRIRYCDICKAADYDNEHVFVSASIKGAHGNTVITDGSTVIVTVYLSGAKRDVWGVKLDMAYANMTPVLNEDGSVKANWVNPEFTGTKAVNANDGYISIMADAQTYVTLNDKVALVELYFTVDSRAATELSVTFEKYEDGENVLDADALDKDGEVIDVMTYDASAQTMVLLDVDGDGYVTIKDAYMAYQLVLKGETNAAVDLDGNGVITGKELKDMYDFIVGAKTYEDILALIA